MFELKLADCGEQLFIVAIETQDIEFMEYVGVMGDIVLAVDAAIDAASEYIFWADNIFSWIDKQDGFYFNTANRYTTSPSEVLRTLGSQTSESGVGMGGDIRATANNRRRPITVQFTRVTMATGAHWRTVIGLRVMSG
ncbi:hypothetical protein CBL_03773 [Carabus blaptoides fortunei]